MNWPDDYIGKVICGDALEIMKGIPDNTIDFILTDPPYLGEYIYLYELLAFHAKRITKKGAFIYAYTGSHFLPRVIGDMSKYLNWFWLFNIRFSDCPRFWAKRLMVRSKPVLVFTNGNVSQKNISWAPTDYNSKKPDKLIHRWEQAKSFASKAIVLRTEKNDIVLDPFIGSGTTAVAAKELGRKYIGIEIEKKDCEIAEQRLSQTQLEI